MSAMWSWKRAAGVTYYRSKETIPIIHPFVGGGYLSNKKWPLNEGNLLIFENISTQKFWEQYAPEPSLLKKFVKFKDILFLNFLVLHKVILFRDHKFNID